MKGQVFTLREEAPSDDELIDIWKEVYPSQAYLQGWNDCAGRFFVPSRSNVKRMLKKIKALKARSTDGVRRKILEAIEADVSFEEPQPVLDGILSSIYAHLVKEGVNEEHLKSLLKESVEALDETLNHFKSRKVTIPVRVLTMYRLDGLVMILKTVKEHTKSNTLKQECDTAADSVKRFVSTFEVKGFGHGTFEEVERLFKAHGFDMGRKSFYSGIIRKAFDYSETPKQLESKAIMWIDRELPFFRSVIMKLSKHYGCEQSVEAVDRAIGERYGFKPADIVDLTKEVRSIIQEFVDQDVGGIHPDYRTSVVETPDYLSGVIPTAAAQFFDTFTTRPYQHYFVTTDPKRDPITNVPQMIDTLVHEEYGHCVHHFNSAMRFAAKPKNIELIFTPLAGAITEGIAFNRELEFLEATKAVEDKKPISNAEKRYVSMLERFGGVHLLNMEIEFEVRKWRLIRFLRVVGDVRVNTGKQSLSEFLTWAHRKTGVSRSSMYYQLFPAHEGSFPGYATTYAIVGEEIREIEKKIRDRNKRIRFSTYVTSLGFPPRTAFKQRLLNFLKE